MAVYFYVGAICLAENHGIWLTQCDQVHTGVACFWKPGALTSSGGADQQVRADGLDRFRPRHRWPHHFQLCLEVCPPNLDHKASQLTLIPSQAPTAGWDSPYEIALLITSVILFAAFAVWEHKLAPFPILPLSIFQAPSFFPLVVVVCFSFMSYATFIWYLVAWQQEIRHWSALSTSFGLAPMALGATSAALVAAWLIPRLAAQWILAIGAFAALVAQVVLATMPARQSYWPSVFPATVVQSLCPDFIFTAAAIIASNSVKRNEQGIAGSLIGTLQLYATSIGLGFAGVVEVHVGGGGDGGEGETVKGYRGALWFGVGLAVVALVVCAGWVRMPKDGREGWEGDDALPGLGRRQDKEEEEEEAKFGGGVGGRSV